MHAFMYVHNCSICLRVLRSTGHFVLRKMNCIFLFIILKNICEKSEMFSRDNTILLCCEDIQLVS